MCACIYALSSSSSLLAVISHRLHAIHHHRGGGCAARSVQHLKNFAKSNSSNSHANASIETDGWRSNERTRQQQPIKFFFHWVTRKIAQMLHVTCIRNTHTHTQTVSQPVIVYCMNFSFFYVIVQWFSSSTTTNDLMNERACAFACKFNPHHTKPIQNCLVELRKSIVDDYNHGAWTKSNP